MIPLSMMWLNYDEIEALLPNQSTQIAPLQEEPHCEGERGEEPSLSSFLHLWLTPNMDHEA